MGGRSAPSSSQASQSPQLSKKQQSISTFFSAKSTPQPLRANSTLKTAGSNGKVSPQHSEDPTDQASDKEEPVKSLKRFRSTGLQNGASDSIKRRRLEPEYVENTAPDTPALTILNDNDLSRFVTEEDTGITNKTSLPHESAPGDDKTSRYTFSQESLPSEAVNEDSEQIRRQKQRLHERFVKKLGRPDSIADIKRRNKLISEETEDADVDEEGDEETEVVKPTKKSAAGKKGTTKLTPMEKQVLDLKKSNMDTLLVVEVGYKYRFFGEDARVAAKELQIVCIPGKFRYDEHHSEAHIDRFASASFPTHRLHVHVKRLVQAGHKVGVVRQLETAALKAVGDNRNTPFVRKLTNLYTKGTYIDDIEVTEADASTVQSSGHLLCLTERNATGWGTDEKVQIGFMAVQPTTGDVIFDDFEDGFMRSELETRLLHISPCEFVVVGSTSKATEKLLSRLAVSGKRAQDARIEHVDKPKAMAAQSYSHISSFYAGRVKEAADGRASTALLDKVHQLSELVTICLSAMITHLTAYGLEHVFDLTKYFQPFSARSHMLLNGNTLSSLEIYQNQTDHTTHGSLLWALDRTRTRFGQRMLRKWVGRPLLDRERLQERMKAVEELMQNEGSTATEKLCRLLKNTRGDLEKSLIRIYYKKCTRPELLAVLQTLQSIANEYVQITSPDKSGFKSSLIADAIASIPCILEDVVSFLERINLNAAKEDDKYGFLREEYQTEAITDYNVGIASVEFELNEQKKSIAETLRKNKVEFVTSSAIEYLIEVDNNQLKHVPASWAKISGTKRLSRFHTPEVIKLVRERDQQKEALANACDGAYTDLLTEIGTRYQSFRDCIQSLATLDCLLSLAEVSAMPGYCKPEFVDEGICIDITGGRHPMVEQLLLDKYVANDIHLSSDARALLLTGPNMGGKSSYVRSVALISIMAQIGCFVPAESARLSLLDAVFTRMGAFDNMMKGESTFMVELNETSDILKQATPRSLVILDELGRGTSTHDGVAIAQAVLDHMIRECKSLTLFITHYQALARLADQWNGELKNMHMKFTESEGDRGDTDITFLYEVGEGTAHRSYGLNVARLAGLPKSLIELAASKSKELEVTETKRRLGYLGRKLPEFLNGNEAGLMELMSGVEQLG